jgi:transcriptional regulator with XRE-family HTH domain
MVDNMSSIKDLVLQSLQVSPAKEQRKNPSPLEALHHQEEITLHDLMSLCLRAEEEEDEQQLTYFVAQILAYLTQTRLSYRLSRQLMRPVEVFALVGEQRWADVRNWVEHVGGLVAKQIYLNEEASLLPNVFAQIDFLRDFFGEGLPEELSDLTGVRIKTVQRWMAGGRPSREHRRQISLLARTFYALRHALGLEAEEALAYYESEAPPRAPTLQELVHKYSGYSTSTPLRKRLLAIGWVER